MRRFSETLRRAFALSMLLGVCGAALAQNPAYPARPVKFIVPITPGGSNDVVARLIAQKLAEAWSQPVVVEKDRKSTRLNSSHG